MASNGAAVEQAIAPVIAAYETTTQTNVNSAQKAQAFSYLENFQKSVRGKELHLEGEDVSNLLRIG
jgi:hypothetical protein